MRQWLIIALIIGSGIVFAQVQEPQDTNIQVQQRIAQEHAATRKFFSDEMTRQRNQIFNDFDERGDFYEKKFNDTLTSATYKLSFLWAGIVFFIVGANSLLRVKLERRRFEKLRENILDEVNRAKKPIPEPPQMDTTGQKSTGQPPQPNMPKNSDRKTVKYMKELQNLEKKREQLLKKAGFNDIPMPEYNFEVNYGK